MDTISRIESVIKDLELVSSDEFCGICPECRSLLSEEDVVFEQRNSKKRICGYCENDAFQVWAFNLALWTDKIGGLDTVNPISIHIARGYSLNFADFSINTYNRKICSDYVVYEISDQAAEFLNNEIEKEYGGYIRSVFCLQ